MNNEEILRLNEIKTAFQIFDKDNDGFINYDEVVTIIRAMNHYPTDKDLAENVPDMNKMYDFAEFFDIMSKFSKQVSIEKILDNSKQFDRDNNGLIMRTDLEFLFKESKEKIDSDEVEDIIAVLEKNKNTININELFKYLHN